MSFLDELLKEFGHLPDVARTAEKVRKANQPPSTAANRSFKAQTQAGEEHLDRIFADANYADLPQDAYDQNYGSMLFHHVGKPDLNSYDLGASRKANELAPVGMWSYPEKAESDIYLRNRLKDYPDVPAGQTSVVTSAKNAFVVGADKPTEAMRKSFIDALERRHGFKYDELNSSKKGYVDSKINHFMTTGSPVYGDISGDEISKIYTDNGIDMLVNGREVVHLRPEQARKPTAMFDPMMKGENNLNAFTGGKPDITGGLMSALGSGYQYMPSDDTYYGEDAVSAPDLSKIPEEVWQNMDWDQKLALITSVVPVVGAATGIMSDLKQMYTKPEERTLTNALLLATNFIPANKLGDVLGIIKNRSSLPSAKDIDPRYGKTGAGSDPRKGDVEKAQATTREKIEAGTQDVPEISIFDLEGKPFVTSMSDRTDAGGLLSAINGQQLKQPVDLLGGQGYMFENAGQVWASDKSPVSTILRHAQQVQKATKGETPLYLPWRMSPTGGDYSHMTGETMLSYADSALGNADKKLLNSKMKEIIPDWKGINSPKAMQQFRDASGDKRKAVIQMMDRDFRDLGGLSAGEARVAVSDPMQLTAREGGLQNVGLIDTLRGRLPVSGHPSYAQGVAGEGIGRLKEDVPAYALLPRNMRQRGMKDPFDVKQSDIRSLMSGASGIITNDVLRAYEEMLKRQL